MASSTVLTGGPSGAIGQAPAFLDFLDRVRRVAPVERPVLLIGERGTGKEMAAQRLHFLSGRWGNPFVTLNCAALAPTLIESELFGHEAGAFTGARGRKVGRFEAADGGTLFLDEISLIPLEVQEKILRVVEYGAIERVGGREMVEFDVRIVGATNVDLRDEVSAGRFKRDLLDRLSFEVLFLPPLRAREGDIPLLATHFAARMAHELGREGVPVFEPEAARALAEHPWPGNVRELKNVVERAVYQSESDEIGRIDFDPFDSPWAPREETGEVKERSDPGCAGENQGGPGGQDALDALFEKRGKDLRGAVREVETRFVARALEACRYNQREAATALGLSYDQFRGLYRKYRNEIEAPSERAPSH